MALAASRGSRCRLFTGRLLYAPSPTTGPGAPQPCLVQPRQLSLAKGVVVGNDSVWLERLKWEPVSCLAGSPTGIGDLVQRLGVRPGTQSPLTLTRYPVPERPTSMNDLPEVVSDRKRQQVPTTRSGCLRRSKSRFCGQSNYIGLDSCHLSRTRRSPPARIRVNAGCEDRCCRHSHGSPAPSACPFFAEQPRQKLL